MAQNTWTADRRLYKDKNGNVVEADSPDRVSLLVAEGGTLSLDDTQRLGLIEVEPAKITTIEPKAQEGPSENKARTKAPANKSGGENNIK
jgi:hypothetical protein